MVSSSGTVGEPTKDTLTVRGDLLEALDDDLPPKKGEDPIVRLLIGRELALDTDTRAERGPIGL